MLENAVRICEAKFGTLFRYDGKFFHRAAGIGIPPALVEFQKQRGAFRPNTAGVLTRVMQTKRVAHSADSAAEPNTARRPRSAARDLLSACRCSRTTS
jgi:two-component system, NtrC family, sensor kinase